MDRITGRWKNSSIRPLCDEWLTHHLHERRKGKDPKTTSTWRVVGLDITGVGYVRIKLVRVDEAHIGQTKTVSFDYFLKKMEVV